MPAPSQLQAYANVQIGTAVVRPAELIPATTTKDMFIATGPVLLTGLFGYFVTAADATACTLRAYITAVPTYISAASASIASTPLGSFVSITGVFATAMTLIIPTVPQALSTMGHGLMIGQIMWPGGLSLGVVTSATNVATMQWVVYYVSLMPGAVVNSI